MRARLIKVIQKGNFFSWFKISRRRTTIKKRGIRASAHYSAYKEQARELVVQKIAQWNQFYRFEFGRVAIRTQKTRWGSCSSKRNLNFNYRIVFLPEELQDYLIVHELCHLQEMNHAAAFWTLVEKTIPSYKILRARLKAHKM